MGKWIRLTHTVGSAKVQVNIDTIWYVKEPANLPELFENPAPMKSPVKPTAPGAVIRFGPGNDGTLNVVESFNEVLSKISAASSD